MPRWLVPTLCTVPVLAVLIGLGSWQVQRLEWKTALIEARRAALAHPPVALPATAPPQSYLGVQAWGRFLTAHRLYIGPRKHRGQAGFHVLTPFRLDDGRTILVDRGFVPGDGRQARPWRDRLGAERRRIEGVLRTDLARPGYAPDNAPKQGVWFWYEIEAMAAKWGLKLQPGVLILSPASDQAGPPAARPVRVDLANNHLDYALTWYGLALVLATVYLLYLRRRRET